VDKVATEIITVPMCMGERGTQGFPPPDNALRDWFASRDSEDQADVAKKPHGFMSSLLIVVHDRLEDIVSKEEYDIPSLTSLSTPQDEEERDCHKSLALTFRDLMTRDAKTEKVD